MTLPPDALSGPDPFACILFALIVAGIAWLVLAAIARSFRR